MSYVASDAQVLTHAPFIAQFSLTCNGKAVNDLPLYYANKADGGFVQASTNYYCLRKQDELQAYFLCVLRETRFCQKC